MKQFDDTKLYALLASDDFDRIHAFLQHYGLDSVDRDGRTFLMTAVVEDKKPLIEYLIQIGCNINAQDSQGLTALHLAAMHDNEKVAQLLLEHGAEMDIQDEYGNTPLWRAVSSNDSNAGVIKCLIEAGADMNTSNNYGTTPKDLLEDQD